MNTIGRTSSSRCLSACANISIMTCHVTQSRPSNKNSSTTSVAITTTATTAPIAPLPLTSCRSSSPSANVTAGHIPSISMQRLKTTCGNMLNNRKKAMCIQFITTIIITFAIKEIGFR